MLKKSWASTLVSVDCRTRAKANRVAQMRLMAHVHDLPDGREKKDAEHRLIALKTGLMELDAEIYMRSGQDAGNA